MKKDERMQKLSRGEKFAKQQQHTLDGHYTFS